jgi:hypothetical protein
VGFDYWLRENAFQNSPYNLEEEKETRKRREGKCAHLAQRECVSELF